MMSEITKGPWIFGVMEWPDEGDQAPVEKPFDFTGPGYYGNPSIMSSSGTEIVGCDEYNVFNNPADTRLMTAAPDLLEALEGMIFAAAAVAVPHYGERKALQIGVDHALKAIAKARGQS